MDRLGERRPVSAQLVHIGDIDHGRLHRDPEQGQEADA